jgi:propanol-preferring alcohol dehydrogenase
MKAVRFVGAGKPLEVVDLPKPQPKPGEVLIRIGGAGVCHSDLHILHGQVPLPATFTLGHENAGWIESLGGGTTDFKEGDAVAVYGAWGCGHCHACALSRENYCENFASLKGMGGGLGFDGGMADYMIVPSTRLLVPLGKLEPRDAAPLSDATLTPYHAVRRALPNLLPGATVLVLGIGGLGQMAVQLIRALSPARIVAGDVDDAKLATARTLGADLTVNTRSAEDAAAQIRAFSGPRGVAVVLDFVGVQPTLDLGAKVIGMDSQFLVVGLGGGKLVLSQMTLPFSTAVSTPYWGTRAELIEVIALAQDGRIKLNLEHFPLDKVSEVYEKLQAGQIKGRAVLIPDQAS